MPKANVIQTDFLAGEISPRLETQDNADGRDHSVELMSNWYPHLQGSAETARGTEWVSDVAETAGRLFSMPVSYDSGYMVVVGTDKVRVFRDHLSPPVIDWPSPWTTEEEIGRIQALMPPDELALYFVSPNVAPYRLQHDPSGAFWGFALIPLVSPPAIWTGGSWPSAIGFFSGRMWLAGTEVDSANFWGSKSGAYFDFTLGILADDAISQRLNRRGAIRWISGGQGLVIGTENAEHVVSASAGLLTPGDIQSKVQSTNGSLAAQSLEVGNETMYISAEGRKIRSIQYEWSKDAWRSRDLTYASEHISGDGNSLTSMSHSMNPDGLILGTTLAGNIISATYEPFSQTVGFARRSTQGKILSVASLPYLGYDEVWMLVDRGGSSLQLEKHNLAENVKMDSYTRITSVPHISSGTVPHLAGKTCQVLLDGMVHPDVIPDGTGYFTTEITGNEILIGLQIDSVIRSLPVEGFIANIGTTRPMRKRMVEIGLKILNSFRPKINGRRVSYTPGGDAATEVLKATDTGWGDEVRITIEQDLPLHTEIAGWFGKIIREDT